MRKKKIDDRPGFKGMMRECSVLLLMEPKREYSAVDIYDALDPVGVPRSSARKILSRMVDHGYLASRPVPYKSDKLSADSPMHNLIKTQNVYWLTKRAIDWLQWMTLVREHLPYKEIKDEGQECFRI